MPANTIDGPGSAPAAGQGLSDNVASGLAYITIIPSIIFLLVEKNNKFVRFHAMQSTLFFIGVILVDLTFFRRHVPVGPPSAAGGDAPPDRDVGAERDSRRVPLLRTADGRVVPIQLLDRQIGLERRDATRHYPDLDEVNRLRVALRAPTLPGLGFGVLEIGTESDGGAATPVPRGETASVGGDRS